MQKPIYQFLLEFEIFASKAAEKQRNDKKIMWYSAIFHHRLINQYSFGMTVASEHVSLKGFILFYLMMDLL